MLNYLKITKNKIKIFLFFLLVYFIFSILFAFLAGVITRIGGFEIIEKMGAITNILEILRLLIVSYITLVFIKKEFFLKKYFKELAILFFAIFIVNELFALLFSLFHNIGLITIDSYIIIQAPFSVLQILVYYMIICFIVKKD